MPHQSPADRGLCQTNSCDDRCKELETVFTEAVEALVLDTVDKLIKSVSDRVAEQAAAGSSKVSVPEQVQAAVSPAHSVKDFATEAEADEPKVEPEVEPYPPKDWGRRSTDPDFRIPRRNGRHTRSPLRSPPRKQSDSRTRPYSTIKKVLFQQEDGSAVPGTLAEEHDAIFIGL